MGILYEKFQALNIDTSSIGLAREENSPYFCTPVGTTVIGWDNGIHYGFIKGFGEMVFAINPETCCDYYVYPLANNFSDFLSLVLAAKGTNALQQIIHWDNQQYTNFINSPEEKQYTSSKEVTASLTAIETLGIKPMGQPFDYIKAIQKNFDFNQIPFGDEYYEITGDEKM